MESKTAHRRPDSVNGKMFALHVIYDTVKQGWEIVHSSLPIVNGGGQVIRTFPGADSRGEAVAFAEKLADPTDEVIVHDDVVNGLYSPAQNSSTYPACQ